MSKANIWWIDDLGNECCRPREGRELPLGMYEAVDKRDYDAVFAKAEALVLAIKFYADPDSWMEGVDNGYFGACNQIISGDTEADNFGCKNSTDYRAGKRARIALYDWQKFKGEL